VAADGSFSFYQDIPNLRVSTSDNGAVVEYGELLEGEPINGFLMELAMDKTNGQALTEVVDLEMRSRKVTGMENRDKRDEILEDKIGFSYEQVGNDGWKIIYFLQSALGSPNYLRVEYTVVGMSQQETDGYSKLVSGILTSLKIYN
jgi:hypothetical protein